MSSFPNTSRRNLEMRALALLEAQRRGMDLRAIRQRAQRPTAAIPLVKLLFRGAAERLQTCTDSEVIISGPAETGKTISALTRLHNLAAVTPGLQGAIVRKTYRSAVASVVQSFVKKVLPKGSGVTPYGGEHPEWFDYPNGARIWVGGMDNPDKVLSSERDVIYVNQAEELELSDWETLTTRATGRAGNLPYGQVMGDANPGPQTHWILARAREGKLTLMESRHEDNPSLFDAHGGITERGARTLAVLDALTGIRKDRLRFGRWVSAEGTVYAFDRALHLVPHFDPPMNWRRVRVADFGYTNPFVCQWWAIDGDGRMFLYREIYMTQRTVTRHAAQINRLSDGESIEATVCDHDAEDRATLEECGIVTEAASKAVSPGIQAVQGRLARAGDGRPRLFVMQDALVECDESLAERRLPTCTAEEFDVYVWPKAPDGKPVKDAPVKLNDHGMDAARYGAMYLQNEGQYWRNV